jgi:hypothetical protein
LENRVKHAKTPAYFSILCNGEMMNIYVTTDHDSHYPVGCCSVVVAESEHVAKLLLDEELVEHGLKPSTQKPYTLRKINSEKPRAFVLLDGDY